MRVEDLEGAELDLWVVRALGLDGMVSAKDHAIYLADDPDGLWYQYSPSTDWSQGGPLIEKETIELKPGNAAPYCSVWWARHPSNGWKILESGPTPLIAAMRALVASVYGDEVQDQSDATSLVADQGRG